MPIALGESSVEKFLESNEIHMFCDPGCLQIRLQQAQPLLRAYDNEGGVLEVLNLSEKILPRDCSTIYFKIEVQYVFIIQPLNCEYDVRQVNSFP